MIDVGDVRHCSSGNIGERARLKVEMTSKRGREESVYLERALGIYWSRSEAVSEV